MNYFFRSVMKIRFYNMKSHSYLSLLKNILSFPSSPRSESSFCDDKRAPKNVFSTVTRFLLILLQKYMYNEKLSKWNPLQNLCIKFRRIYVLGHMTARINSNQFIKFIISFVENRLKINPTQFENLLRMNPKQSGLGLI